MIQPVTTMQIYKGAIPFVLIQLVMVSMLIAFPGIVTGSLDKKVEVNMEAVGNQMMESLDSGGGYGADNPYAQPEDAAGGADAPAAAQPQAEPVPESGDFGSDDPSKALQDALSGQAPAQPGAPAASQ